MDRDTSLTQPRYDRTVLNVKVSPVPTKVRTLHPRENPRAQARQAHETKLSTSNG